MPTGKRPWRRTTAAMFCLTAFGSSQTILTTLSKSDGVYLFNPSSVPLLAEVLKLAVCTGILCSLQVFGKSPKVTWSAHDLLLRYSIPSVIYAALNNIHFASLFYLSPPSFQLISNLKIATTAVLFRLFLKRKLAPQRWFALGLLTLGTTLSELRLTSRESSVSKFLEGLLSSPWQGLLWAILGAWLSAAAGVYTEFLMKRTDDSMFWQNAQLYLCGVVANAVNVTATAHTKAFPPSGWRHLVSGYNMYTWMLVANMAITGLSVSYIMKFADVLVKVYATSMSLFLTAFLSFGLFSIVPTLELCLGMVVTCWSMYLFFQPLQNSPKQVLRED